MTIVVGTDRSENSRAAMRVAARLAARLDEPLIVASALELWERTGDVILPTFEDVDIEPSKHATDLVRAFVERTLGTDDVELDVVVGHPPAERLLRVAADRNASLIAAGTSGRSKLGEAFFGSTISALVRASDVPVLAVPPDFYGDFERILAPVDFSRCSEASLRVAVGFSRRLNAGLWVQHVSPYFPDAYVSEALAENVHRRSHLEELVERMDASDVVRGVRSDVGPAHPEILGAVDELAIDLVIMGTHGRSGLDRVLLGSTAERMLRERTCPVLVVTRHES